MAGKARPETVLFLAEQAAEKALKAVLCHRKQLIPLSHEIILLLQRLGDNQPPQGAGLVDLIPFSTIRRYEEGKAEISPSELAAAMKIVEDAVNWCAQQMGVK